MTGQLHEHPLAELLHEITAAGLSGALRLEHERLKTVVYLADGELIYAASNLRQHRLSECVRRWQLLSEEQLSRLPAGASDLDFAAALMDESMLSRESLEMLQVRQVTEVLRPALLWTEGTWEFNARVRIAPSVRVRIDLGGLLTESARRLPAEFAAARFPDTSEKLFPQENAPDRLELLPIEAFVRSRVDAPLSVEEMIAISSLPEIEAKQVAYTLTLGGLLRRERWPLAFSPEMLDRARSVKATAKSAPLPTSAGQQPATKSAVAEPTVGPAPAVKSEADEALELDQFFSRLAVAENHYQALGVLKTAAPDEIKATYHKLAKRFHPDRFRRNADAQLHARIEEAFARIAQAYETLKSKPSRAAYDLKLAQAGAAGGHAGSAAAFAQPQEPDAGKPVISEKSRGGSSADYEKFRLLRQAEESFQKGMSALKNGQAALAVASLGEAARLVPQEAKYRAYHGRALAEYEGTWRQAEAELKAALSIDSKNGNYYVMLAEFYLKIGLPRRARGELERTLAIDSQNAAARRLLETLKGRG
jgi:curved DNA-binding protein CbpA